MELYVHLQPEYSGLYRPGPSLLAGLKLSQTMAVFTSSYLQNATTYNKIMSVTEFGGNFPENGFHL